MKHELLVQEGASLCYTIAPDITQFVCRVGAYAKLVLVHAPDRDAALQMACVLGTASTLQMRGWYEHGISAHIQVLLQGAQARAEIKLGAKLSGSASAHIVTLQRHEAPRTHSVLLAKSLLSGYARMSHTGMIHVTHEAVDTQAALQSRHMLMSRDAHACVQPNLEVLTDQVQCAHGSAIGAFDADMLFYMQSRGIDPLCATQLLEEAFFVEIR